MTDSKKSPLILKLNLILVLACLSTIPLTVFSQSKYHRSLNEKQIEIQKLEQLLSSKTDTNGQMLWQLAQSCHNAGHYDDALVYYKSCVKIKLFADNSLFACTNIYLKQGNIQQAREAAGKINNPDLASLAKAKIEFAVANYAGSMLHLNKIPENTQFWGSALYEKAKIEFARGNMEKAEEILNSISPAQSQKIYKNYLLAEITLSHKRDPEKAERLILLSLDNYPLHSDSHRLLGLIHFRKKEMEKCEEELRLALLLDKYNFAARSALGNGRIAASYPTTLLAEGLPGIRKAFHNYSRPEDSEKAVAQLLSLSQKDNSPQILTDLATIYYSLGDLEKAEHYANLALKECDYWGLSHFIISLCQQKRIRNQDLITTPIKNTILAEKTETPEILRQIFINFDVLSPRQQQMVLLSIQPLSKQLSKIKEAGGTFYFLPLNHFLWEAEKSIVSAGDRTFDGRLWDDVKGVGGQNSVAGIAELDEALEGGFNVLAHEFAHQIHYMAFDQTRQNQIKELYKRSIQEKSTLDYYAAANEMEYFAQGYEAYVSVVKRPLLKSTAGHTRQELLAKDPALFKFIAELCQEDSSTGR